MVYASINFELKEHSLLNHIAVMIKLKVKNINWTRENGLTALLIPIA